MRLNPRARIKIWGLAVVTAVAGLAPGAAGTVGAHAQVMPSAADIVLACQVQGLVACVENEVARSINDNLPNVAPVLCPTPGDFSCVGGAGNSGYTGPDQLLGATQYALATYRNKVQQARSTVAAAYTNVSLQTTTSTSTNANPASSASLAYDQQWCYNHQCPPSSAQAWEDGQIEPDGYCGPTSAANVLYSLAQQQTHYNIYDIANAMAYPNSYNSNNGIGRGQWNKTSHRWEGMLAINYWSENTPTYNHYVWQDLGNANDLWYYTVEDLWGTVGPIYNIADAVTSNSNYRNWQYPLHWYTADYWPGHVIRHYFPAFGYYGSQMINIFDENNYLASNNHYQDVSAADLYTAVVANGAPPQILW